jgi:putative transposase
VQARNDGWVVNHKKIQRLWGDEGLQVIVKHPQKRAGGSDLPTITKAEAPGNVWAVDFKFHSTVEGKPLKILSVVDEHTRGALGGQVGYSITASELTDELDVLTIERGSPRALRMDNGPEFISKTLRGWAREVDLVFIPPGQPWRNGFIECFNGGLRDECLSVNQFHSLSHAKCVIGMWKEEYNQTRPHSSPGYLAPAVYAQQCIH